MGKLLLAVLLAAPGALAQVQEPAAIAAATEMTAAEGNFKLVLPSQNGELLWHADGFKIMQNSAKPQGAEIGVRAQAGTAGRFVLLGFLFQAPGEAPFTGAKCRDATMEGAKHTNASMHVTDSGTIPRPNGLSVEVVNYTAQTRDGVAHYSVRGFVASGEMCGDLEAYGDQPMRLEDPEIQKIFASFRLDPAYVPQFLDASLYAEILYRHQLYSDAAPIFGVALDKLNAVPAATSAKIAGQTPLTWRRVTADQEGMSYGISGNVGKARTVFEAAIAKDPGYPMYYYNLACADAAENKLADARAHLQQAFARKANVIMGEKMPDPSKDDSFLPYRNDKAFWAFVQTLH